MALTILLLVLSNVFMTFAWYGHLRHQGGALWLIILASWGIAFFEYCLMIPANRHGYAAGLSAAQLKTLQELITLVVFSLFAVLWLKEPLRWNVVAGFLVMALGAALVFAPWEPGLSRPAPPAQDPADPR
ncbi:MAG: DMT family protein [Alphaproteobacteria bacterium]|nr:DMT family protein [Alphaproteobacteria bacterium]MCB9794248.1 DMT family protein [Alphaproteobacteria bacterium]